MVLMNDGDRAMQEHYDNLWAGAQAAFAAVAPGLDPHLLDRAGDRRRGATLLIRPSAAVAERVAAALDQLRALEPQQYYYQPHELHVTVLSLWSGTEQPEPYFAQLPIYRAAIEPVLSAAPALSLHFAGLTASPAAVMVQGFAHGPHLNDLRDRLRAAIAAAGLGHTLDGRYRISAAHMTAVRFYRPFQDLPRFNAALHALRQSDFGISAAAEIHLVANDWYMSADQVRIIERYPLPHATMV